MLAGDHILLHEKSQPAAQQNPSQPADEILIKRFHLKRDPACFRILVERYQHFAFRIAFGICSDSALAEEAVQEAFVQAARSDSGFTSEGEGSFRAWFYAVIINVARMHQRAEYRIKRRAQSSRFKEEVETVTVRRAEGMKQDELTQNETLIALRRALGLIDKELRLPIILHFLNGQSQTDVGRLLGISGSQVSRRISKGLGLLRDRMVKSGFSISLMGLSGLLKDSDVLPAPESLQVTLRQIDLTEISSFSSPSGVEVPFMSRLRAPVWAIVTFVFVGVALGTTYIATNVNIPMQENAKAPDDDASFSRTWTFEDGLDQELEVVQGAAFWKKPKDGRPGAMVLPFRADLVHGVLLPGKIPEHGPFVVSITGRFNEIVDYQIGCTWTDGVSHLAPRRYWKFGNEDLSIDWQFELKAYFWKRFVILLQSGRRLPVRVLEYARSRPAAHILISCENLEIERLEWRSVKENELPDLVLNIERETENYKKARKGFSSAKFSGPDEMDAGFEGAFRRAVHFRKKWTFETGLPKDLTKLSGGILGWARPEGKKRARMRVPGDQPKGTLIQFPDMIPIAPIEVRMVGYLDGSNPGLEFTWTHETYSAGRLLWIRRFKGQVGKRVVTRTFLLGKYALCFYGEQLVRVMAFERPWPAMRLMMAVRDYEIEEIEVIGLESMADLPLAARNLNRLFRTENVIFQHVPSTALLIKQPRR